MYILLRGIGGDICGFLNNLNGMTLFIKNPSMI